jgi:oligoribonuclease (3'-5' exoribonuclease)
MDTLLVHAREVFRLAIVTAANSLIVMHNLCVAAHKLCYVKRRVMCSHFTESTAEKWLSRGKDYCATY